MISSQRLYLPERTTWTLSGAFGAREWRIPLALTLTLGHVRAASETSKGWTEFGVDGVKGLAEENTLENIGEGGWSVGLDLLRDEAAKSVGILKVFGSVDEASRNIRQVDT